MTKKIASIHFEALTADRPLYHGVFRIPAVAKGAAPVVLEIPDHIQRDKKPHTMGGGQSRDTILGEEIAGDLIKVWTTHSLGMTVDCGPGVWVVRDVLPVLDSNGNPTFDAERSIVMREATDEEKAAMWAEDLANAKARQDKWAEAEILRADALFSENPANVRWIGPTPRAACKYMGREREWLHEMKAEDMKLCPFCSKGIAHTVVKCPHCSEVVDRQRYAELTGTAPKPPLAPPVKNPKEQAA